MARKNILTGLDIGSSKIKIITIQAKSADEIQVLSQIKEHSSGVKKGVVVNIDDVADIISSSVGKVEEEINKNINKVYVNINGSHVFATSSRGLVSVSRADQRISKGDVDRVLQAAEAISLPSNKEILEVFPKEYIVDGIKGIREPVGMQGVRLEADVIALGCLSPFLNNLTQAVQNSNLQIINNPIITPLASSLAVLSSKEKELGVALLDIGASTTGLAVFEDENLIHVAIFPFGSANITNDIAIFFRTNIDVAERMKIEFGSCFYCGADKKEKLKEDSSSELLIFSRKILVEVIEARVSEIFSQVNKELKKISRQGLLPSGIVLTGGGAMLPKIVEFAKKELKLPCRIGRPSKNYKNFFSKIDDPSMSAACGLVLHGLYQEDNYIEPNIFDKIKRAFRVFIP